MSSRKSKVLKNAKIALLFFFITLTLNFVSRAVFIKYLGSEVVGLSTLVSNIIGFLNLAELGIVSAVASSLYKPIHDNDKQSIKEIITIQGWLYRKVAYIVTFGAVILMAFFPIIFKKVNLPFWYPYSLFLVLLTSSLLTYFITYKQILLIAELKEYKITIIIKSITILKVSLQIICVTKFSNPFNIWLTLEFLFGVLSSVILNFIISKEYPWLNTELKNGRAFSNNHPKILLNIKQLFFHKIAGFVLLQTTPLIIYHFLSLKLVTIYDNYMIIFLGLNSLFIVFFSSFQSGIGNLVATSNNKIVLQFFHKYYIIRAWLSFIVSTVFYLQVEGFITLWLGEDYILGKQETLMMSIYLFVTLTRVFDSFLVAYSLYSDIYAPIVEALLCLSLSIILGYFFSLSGILLGVIISLITIVYIWKPYYLYKNGFKIDYIDYLKLTGILIASFALSLIIYFRLINMNSLFILNYPNWILQSIWRLATISSISLIILFVIHSYSRRLLMNIGKKLLN